MSQVVEAVAAVVMVILIILGIILIATPLSMSSSDDIGTKIEGILSAPLLIAAGITVLSIASGIAIALLKKNS